MASNRSTADFMISSTLMSGDYPRRVPDYEGYLARPIAELPVLEPLEPVA